MDRVLQKSPTSNYQRLLKCYILYDFIYITLLKRQNCRNEQISSSQDVEMGLEMLASGKEEDVVING